jgi:hypothetical protein
MADWEKLGRSAGPIRNQAMLDEGRPDLVVAFPGHHGTADMVRRARAAGVMRRPCADVPPNGVHIYLANPSVEAIGRIHGIIERGDPITVTVREIDGRE